jgi:hypothetical protein
MALLGFLHANEQSDATYRIELTAMERGSGKTQKARQHDKTRGATYMRRHQMAKTSARSWMSAWVQESNTELRGCESSTQSGKPLKIEITDSGSSLAAAHPEWMRYPICCG